MDLSSVPCIDPEKDLVLTTAALTPSPGIYGNLGDMITIQKGNGRYSMKVRSSAILPACS